MRNENNAGVDLESAALEKLEALALAATPGPWAYQEDSDAYTHIIRPVASPGWIIASATQTSKPEGEANGRWIAAANPATILALIDLARRASASQISKDAGGWKWVPVEPTIEMRHACHAEYQRSGATYDSLCRAIVVAAPSNSLEFGAIESGAAAKTEQAPMKRAGWFVHEGGAWVATSSDDPRATVLYRGEASARAAGARSEQRMVEVLAALEELSGGAEIAKSEEWVNARASVVLAALARAQVPEQDDDAPAEWKQVFDEVARATRKFPTWPTDPLHAVAVLGEEFGELTKAVLQTTYEPHKVEDGELRMEAIQTAAMALRFLASLNQYEFTRCAQHSQGAAMSASRPDDKEGGV
jgi:hypothetical protein